MATNHTATTTEDAMATSWTIVPGADRNMRHVWTTEWKGKAVYVLFEREPGTPGKWCDYETAASVEGAYRMAS